MKTKILLMFILFSGLLFSSENISDRVASDFLLRNNSFSKNQHIYPNYMISNIFSKDSNFVRNIKGKDKIMHSSYSALLTYYIYNFSQDIYNNSHQKSINLSISLTGTLGLSKEFSDEYIKKTKFSWYDLGYDFAGICFGLIALNNLR